MPSEDEKLKFPEAELNSEADDLIKSLEVIDNSGFSVLEKLRKKFLYKQLIAVKAKIEMIGGRKFRFDEESKLLYDAVAPHYTQEHLYS